MTPDEFRARQRVVELGARFLSYVDEGSGAREPVVLLHGLPTWGYVWHQLLADLSPLRRVLIPDLLGFGYSDKSDRFDRSIARQTEAIVLWLDHLGVSRAIIVGHDLGGGVALRLAALHPERVARLVLMNGVSYDSWPIELMLQLGHPGARRTLSAKGLGLLLRSALARGFARRPPADLIPALVAPYTTEVGKISLMRAAAALNTNLTMEIADHLPSLAVPTLILWGAEDRFQPLRYGQRLAWDIPGAKLVSLEGARHFVMFDRSGDVAWHLRTLLEQPAAVPELGLAAAAP
jgi:pimeloyl-ACP methyl ester carboxylesterase